MKTIKCLKDLEGYTLQYNDTVILKGIEYTVDRRWMNNPVGLNDKIFSDLKLNRYRFCSTHYGYEVNHGDWPEFRDNDYAAATRVVKALYEIIESQYDVPSVSAGLPEKWVVKVTSKDDPLLKQLCEYVNKLPKALGWCATEGYYYSDGRWSSLSRPPYDGFILIDINHWATEAGVVPSIKTAYEAIRCSSDAVIDTPKRATAGKYASVSGWTSVSAGPTVVSLPTGAGVPCHFDALEDKYTELLDLYKKVKEPVLKTKRRITFSDPK